MHDNNCVTDFLFQGVLLFPEKIRAGIVARVYRFAIVKDN
jgi:hypothetical protein